MTANLGIEPGQIWENRNPRRDGSRERMTVIEVDGGGSPQLGNLRLVQTASGNSVHFGPDGAVAPEVARDLEGVAGLEALASEGQ